MRKKCLSPRLVCSKQQDLKNISSLAGLLVVKMEKGNWGLHPLLGSTLPLDNVYSGSARLWSLTVIGENVTELIVQEKLSCFQLKKKGYKSQGIHKVIDSNTLHEVIFLQRCQYPESLYFLWFYFSYHLFYCPFKGKLFTENIVLTKPLSPWAGLSD